MAAFKHLEKGTIKHVPEGSWQHDYVRYSPLWAEATDDEVAADIARRAADIAARAGVPAADTPEPDEPPAADEPAAPETPKRARARRPKSDD